MRYRNESDYNNYASGYGSTGYRHEYRSPNREWTDRAGDEVRSWLGDEEAERRRRMDESRDRMLDQDSHYNRYQASAYGRGNYSVPGLEPGDRNFGRAEYEWDSPVIHEGRYGSRSGQPVGHHREWTDRAGDEVRSWFGDDDAERRRRMDERRDRISNAGPSTYNRGHDMSWTHDYEDDLDRDWVRRHNQTINRSRYNDRDLW